MTAFSTEKLSNILTRMIIAPQDRSQLLPLTTPIYCPDNNGVKATKVQIINPNRNFKNNVTENTTSYGGYGFGDIKFNNDNGQLNSTTGLYTPNDYELGQTAVTSEELPKIQVAFTWDSSADNGDIFYDGGTTIGFMNGGLIYGVNRDNITLARTNLATKHVYRTGDRCILTLTYYTKALHYSVFCKSTVQNLDAPDGYYKTETLSEFVTSSESTARQLSLHGPKNNDTDKYISYDFTKTGMYIDGTLSPLVVPAKTTTTQTSTDKLVIGTTVTLTKEYDADGRIISSSATSDGISNKSNVIDVDISSNLTLTYILPHEVDLESNVNLIDLIKADFAAKFKHAVSTKVYDYLAAFGAQLPEVTHGDTIAKTLGKVLADNISNGTGQKFSILRYSNGAPVPYLISSNQPNIDKAIQSNPEAGDDCIMLPGEYTCVDSGQAALYYCEQPTLILPEVQFEEVQTGLVEGTIKEYALRKINIDTAHIDFTQIGEGIFGSNDSFAVAFTQPKITIAPDQDVYANDISISIDYGVNLISKDNLRKIV